LLNSFSNGIFQLGGPLQSVVTIESGINKEVFSGITFDQFFLNTSFSLAPNKSTFISFFGTFGDAIDFENIREGQIVRLLPGVNLRLGRHVVLDLSHTFEKLNIQAVDEETTTLFSQFIFSYKINPRTVLFLGYSDNHFGIVDVPLTRLNRTLFFKVGYAWQP
jgi:hypothetical protein